MVSKTRTLRSGRKVCFSAFAAVGYAHNTCQGSAILVADIADTRTHIADLNLNKNIPVGNSDAGSYFADDVLEVIDYGVRRLAFREG